MSKLELVISRLSLSGETKSIQERLEELEVGQAVEYNGKVYTKTQKDLCEVEYSSNWEAYKFSRNDTVGSYEVKVDISSNDIETVIVNSFEGGSNYWLGLDTENDKSVWGRKPKGVPYSTWATQMLLEGETLHFYDVEEESEKFTLNLEQLVNGFKINAEKRPHDCDLENGDAITSDCILQYGVFGKLVYG